MKQLVEVRAIEHLTHDVVHLTFDKPAGYTFTPGQAADIAIDRPGWAETLSCFTFTSLPEEDHLEFVIKTYPSRKRVSNELLSVKPGEKLWLHDPFGDISYQGPGLFIAGGAGITPFLAILKGLEKRGEVGQNTLIFGNRTKGDIILEDYFRGLLGDRFVNVLSEEEVAGYGHGYVTADIIQAHQAAGLDHYYLCAPPPMQAAVKKALAGLGVKPEQVVQEGS